jgi:hypothetical protein
MTKRGEALGLQYPLEVYNAAAAYLQARRAQERHPSNSTLDEQRTAAHDSLMWELQRAGIAYDDREDAARLAQEIVGLDYDAARLAALMAAYAET